MGGNRGKRGSGGLIFDATSAVLEPARQVFPAPGASELHFDAEESGFASQAENSDSCRGAVQQAKAMIQTGWLSLLKQILFSSALGALCAGCCTFNCGVPDLTFISLSKPTEGGAQITEGSRKFYRISYKPGELKLRFATKRNLFRLQERNDASGPSLWLTLCGDRSALVSARPVYTEDGWTTDRIAYGNDYIEHGVLKKDPSVPPQPFLHPTPDGLFVYEAPIKLDSVMLTKRGQFDGRDHKFLPLPRDPHDLPELCFNISVSGYVFFRFSDEVSLPHDAIIKALSDPTYSTQPAEPYSIP